MKICDIKGHRWVVTGGLKTIFKGAADEDLHIMCGLKGYCDRCGEQWDDVTGDAMTSMECEPILRNDKRIKHPRKLTILEKLNYL